MKPFRNWYLLAFVGAILCGTGLAAARGQAGQAAPPAQGRAQGAGAAAGQRPAAPTRDANAQPVAGTGSIEGAVILEGAGTPVRRARLTLSGVELRGQRTAISDEQGHFAFPALPAGRYTLTASKAGYVDMTYGAKRAGRPGTPIQLADAQKLDKATIRLPKGSVVTGVVVDENGEPSPGTQVRVMKFVMRTGEKTLQQSGQAQTDDRGIYRIYSLQPGDYIVSATPRNANLGDLQQTIMATIESLTQQAQAAGGGAGGAGGAAGGRGGGGAGGGRAGGQLGSLLGGGGGRGQQFLDQATQLQQQLTQSQQEQTVGYAPVYYPGTIASSGAATVTLAVGEEHSGVDFQLQLVPTAKVEGTIISPDGKVPQGAQVALVPTGQGLTVPGGNTNMARVTADGKFTFTGVTPGQYTVAARAIQRVVDPSQPADPTGGRGGRGGPGGPGGFGGPGGRGGPGGEVLWASQDITVAGQNLPDLALNLQPGMTISGRIDFRSQGTQPPTDLTTIRVTAAPQGQQILDIGPGVPPAQVEANGNFTIKGIAPGKYILRANVQGGGGRANGAGAGGAAAGGGGRGGAAPAAQAQPGGGSWTLKSSMASGQDTLDFPVEIKPHENVSGAVITFTDRVQTLTGTLQDATGRPTSDYTIIVFAAEKQYWTPAARRIVSARPGTDGKFSFRGLPAGSYRITAVTDVEPGEWYDPAFLEQVLASSVLVTLNEGDTKNQDLKLAGGGH